MKISHAWCEDDLSIDKGYNIPYMPACRPCECSATIPMCHHCVAWWEELGDSGASRRIRLGLRERQAPRRARNPQAPGGPRRRPDRRPTADLWRREDELLDRLRMLLAQRNALPSNDRRSVGLQEEVRMTRQMLRNIRNHINYVARPDVLNTFEEPPKEGRPLPATCPRGHAFTEGSYRVVRLTRNTSKGRVVRTFRQCTLCQKEKKAKYVNATHG